MTSFTVFILANWCYKHHLITKAVVSAKSSSQIELISFTGPKYTHLGLINEKGSLPSCFVPSPPPNIQERGERRHLWLVFKKVTWHCRNKKCLDQSAMGENCAKKLSNMVTPPSAPLTHCLISFWLMSFGGLCPLWLSELRHSRSRPKRI